MTTQSTHIVFNMTTESTHIVFNMTTQSTHIVFNMTTQSTHIVFNMTTQSTHIVFNMTTQSTHIVFNMTTESTHIVFNMRTQSTHIVFNMTTESTHKVIKMVFNLSGQGEVSHFLPRVLELGWADQLAPALERLCSICKALDSWITQHPQHVAVLHARGGYEKLGVVVAAYMHYSNICASTDQALDRYAMKRFFDDKIGQLYHPSQKRYVQYFAGLLSGVIRINSSPLYLHTLTLFGIPHFEPRGGCHLFIKIYQGMTPIYTSGIYNLADTMRQVTIVFETGVQLRGDILLKAYHRRLIPASREVIFRMQFHTCAVSEKILAFARNDLDDACNDMRFPLDGSVELYFTHSPDERPRTVSNVSCDKSPCAIASWNSYENIDFTFEQMDDPDSKAVFSIW
ncbi:tensin-1 [Procambarus clarkii]|uniref:tensin-1 n=1 Tax=Procambarus clarkii TaxID=6728 RepID=UPI003743D641